MLAFGQTQQARRTQQAIRGPQVGFKCLSAIFCLLALLAGALGQQPSIGGGGSGGQQAPAAAANYELLNGGAANFGAAAPTGSGSGSPVPSYSGTVDGGQQQQQQQQQPQGQWMGQAVPAVYPSNINQPAWSIAPPDQQQQQQQFPEESATTPASIDGTGMFTIEPPNILTSQRPPSSAAESTTNGGGGIVSYILSPLSSVYRHAKRLFGDTYENGVRSTISDGVDAIRLETYKMFMQLYNKTYSAEEIPRRMALFFERRKQIEDSVKSFMEGKALYYLRENDFIDWDAEELKKLFGLSKPSDDQLTDEDLPTAAETSSVNQQNSTQTSSPLNRSVSRSEFNYDDMSNSNNTQVEGDEDGVFHGHRMSVKGESIPTSVDWRETGCVSRPINQGKCGACYAISTMSVVETMRCINKVAAPTLSPQQVVDCANTRAGYKNYGCDGGWPTQVLAYLRNVGTAARETCYPYVHRAGSCRLSLVKSRSACSVNSSPTDTSIQYKVLHNERDILYHVAKTGPVVTVMQATDSFLMYGKGIFDDWRCTRRRDDVDHAIVIVGYGRENGVDYWLIKNSWGTSTWGEGGYGKFRRGKNACSIGFWGWVVTR